jgi:hypothetical protein
MAEKIDEETFNLEIRKFLKQVGVTSQREIERAVREALKTGKLKGGEHLRAQVTLTIPAINLTHKIEDDIALS